MELVDVVANNTKTKEIISFPINNIDTTWMNKSQKRFFEVLKINENKNKKYNEICTLAGFKSTGPWYKAIKDERFTTLLETIGVKVKLYNEHYPSHNEVEYIKNPTEREEYFKSDIWDMRKLFEEYPRHIKPAQFIVKFTKISNVYIRYEIKRYFMNMISSWYPATFHRVIK